MRMGQIISRVKSVERGGMEGRTWKVEHGRPSTPPTKVEKYLIAARKLYEAKYKKI